SNLFYLALNSRGMEDNLLRIPMFPRQSLFFKAGSQQRLAASRGSLPSGQGHSQLTVRREIVNQPNLCIGKSEEPVEDKIRSQVRGKLPQLKTIRPQSHAASSQPLAHLPIQRRQFAGQPSRLDVVKRS